MLYFVISFLYSTFGAICGIGGGIIIKPVLDMFSAGSVSAINFLSGCTVLSMGCYSVGKALRSGNSGIDLTTGTPLALGAAMGGAAGKQLFSIIRNLVGHPDMVGGIQALCLSVITVGTLAYTLRKAHIRTMRLQSRAACLVIGYALGMMSSFLGIGGGPINLVVLYHFFSMDTKTAAANSLYIILFSQSTSLLSTLVTGSVPAFAPATLALMVAGGILGGILGRKINKKIDSRAVDKLFIALMAIIILISARNALMLL